MFKSEEVFAKFLDDQGKRWFYEPRKFNLSFSSYTPDFYCVDNDTYYEVANGKSTLIKKEAKMNLFEKEYPDLKLKVVTPKGKEIPKIDGRYCISKANVANHSPITAFSIPKELLEKVKAVAKEEDRPISYIYRKIVREHFEGK